MTADQLAGPAADSAALGAPDHDSVARGEEAVGVLTTTVDPGALPEVTFLLVAAGLACVALRLGVPGFGAAGVVAATLLLFMGGAGLVAMPVRASALLLLACAGAALCLEVLSFPGIGLHASGAGVSLLLAGLYLHDDVFAVHPGVVVPAALAISVVIFVAGRCSPRYVNDQPLHGSGRLVGRRTVVLTADGAAGVALLADHLWDICSDDGSLDPGQPVRVTQAFDDWLLVESIRGPERP